MKHYARQFGSPRRFTDIVTIQMEGHSKCGADFDVLVEFSAEPDDFDPSTGTGNAGEREIIDVRWPIYAPGTNRLVVDSKPLPDFLVAYVRDCIDLGALDADFSDC